jgi:hypothetical protein
MNTVGHSLGDSVATYITADEWQGYPTWVVHTINIGGFIGSNYSFTSCHLSLEKVLISEREVEYIEFAYH